MLARYLLILVSLTIICQYNALVIYRRKPKPKLANTNPTTPSGQSNNNKICHEEYLDNEEIIQPSFWLLNPLATARSSSDQKAELIISRKTENTSPYNNNKSQNTANNNNLNKIRKREAVIIKPGENVIENIESNIQTTGKSSEKIFINIDDDQNAFEIVGDFLNEEEKALIRQKLAQTCHSLNLT